MLSLFIVAIESQPSKMKYHTVGKVPKYNRKIAETQKQKSMLATHIDDNDRIQWDYKF
jgi:cell division protein FtsL